MIEWLREWAANYVATVFTSRNVITLQGYSADEEVANILRMFINWLERTGATLWRSVEDGLPEEGQEIFALHCDPISALFNGFHAEARTYCAIDNLKWMVYWTPIPPLPKEEE